MASPLCVSRADRHRHTDRQAAQADRSDMRHPSIGAQTHSKYVVSNALMDRVMKEDTASRYIAAEAGAVGLNVSSRSAWSTSSRAASPATSAANNYSYVLAVSVVLAQ